MVARGWCTGNRCSRKTCVIYARRAWSGLRPWLPDHLPAIGPSRAVPGLWLATGHEGAGVALGPVTGRLVAQLYAGEPPVVDPEPFDPDRFGR